MLVICYNKCNTHLYFLVKQMHARKQISFSFTSIHFTSLSSKIILLHNFLDNQTERKEKFQKMKKCVMKY